MGLVPLADERTEPLPYLNSQHQAIKEAKTSKDSDFERDGVLDDRDAEDRRPFCGAVVEAERAGGDDGGVLVEAAEEGDGASHEDQAQEDPALGRQATWAHCVPTAPQSPP